MDTSTVDRVLIDLPGHARVWVYKSAERLSAAQQGIMSRQGLEFTTSWAAHGAALDARVQVLFDHFVVIAVDEAQAMASGCSIDKSVHFVQRLERELNVQLTDRMVVLYEREGELHAARAMDVEDLLKNGTITADTFVFDDLVSTVADLRARFRVPLRHSWMARFL